MRYDAEQVYTAEKLIKLYEKLNRALNKISTDMDSLSNEITAINSGMDYKASVKTATTADILLTGLQSIDDVVLKVEDRILVKNQIDATANGIYVVSDTDWVRSADADTDAKVTPGMFVIVEDGTTNGGTAWLLINDTDVTLGTTPLSFINYPTLIKYVQGFGVKLSDNIISLSDNIDFGQLTDTAVKTVQHKRGTTVEHTAFTGNPGEITVDTTKKTAVLHDGSTAGGIPLAKEVHNHLELTSGENTPTIKFEPVSGKWVYSNNGVDFVEIGVS